MIPERVNFKQLFSILIKLSIILKQKGIEIPQEIDNFRVKSPNFNTGDEIPKTYTPYGEDIHPALSWSGFPKRTRSFAIICEDPDTPSGKLFTHWAVKNIPLHVTKIKEGESVGEEIVNSWGFTRYSGPKPPNGKHRYFFRIYALKIDKLRATDMKSLREEIERKKIGEAVIMGTFG